MCLLMIFFVVLLCELLVGGRVSPPTVSRDVETSQGVVRGYLAPSPPHFAFLGVSYGRVARAGRFKAPRPPKPWDGTYEATYRVRCPQPGGEGDEDCLVLNIFAPEAAGDLPVLVMVHDGAFQYGWGQYQPPTRLLQNFVIVTFNYRVGALGFLCLGTEEVPGNAGLKDQVAALYWIQKNIRNFGGNPSDVTVYGVGAGAAALELVLLSDLSRGLLHKVILESGSALSPLTVAYDPVSLAFDAAAALGYTGSEDENELATFFEEIPTKQMTKLGKMFLPCNDRNSSMAMFEADPIDVLKSGIYHKVPMIVVYTDKIEVTEMDKETFTYIPQSFEHLLPNNLEFPLEDVKEKVAEFVQNFYFDEEEVKNDLVRSYVSYFNDITIEYPVIKSAVFHASDSSYPVYLMKFTFNSDFQQIDSNFMDHTLLYYFYAKDNLSEKDEIVAQKLVTLWTNFIKIGDPTPLITTLIPVVWPPLQPTEPLPQADIMEVTGLEFGHTMAVRDTLSTHQVAFWDNIYRRFYRMHN